MTWRLAWRSLAARPVRSAVLAGGFGLGIGVMASLLGIGEVILEQARSPQLVGGGDLVVTGATGRLTNARHVLAHVLGSGPLSSEMVAASPLERAQLYLVQGDEVVPVSARGGVPSAEARLGDVETRDQPAWQDGPRDASWSAPPAHDVLRAMDRFHPIPDVPDRAPFWAEWLYFNGEAEEASFYLTFLVGPATDSPGVRQAAVSLQLEHDGRTRRFGSSGEVLEDHVLRHAPDLNIAGNTVRLEGMAYRIRLDLEGVHGEIVVEAEPGRSMPPVTLHGARGWLSGYVVPVISGRVTGFVEVEGQRIELGPGHGYHDHNWGFWRDVRWQWGQVTGDELSFVFGRIVPPAEAADADRVPSLLVVLGPEGPVGVSVQASIEEHDGPDGRPAEIEIRGGNGAVDLTLRFEVRSTEVSRLDTGGPFGDPRAPLEFLQKRGVYNVRGQVGDRRIDFRAAGSAETFRAPS